MGKRVHELMQEQSFEFKMLVAVFQDVMNAFTEQQTKV